MAAVAAVNLDEIARQLAGANGPGLRDPHLFLETLGLVLFAGYFAAMALVSTIAAAVLRSWASLAYAALMTVMVAIMLHSLGLGHDVGGDAMRAVLVTLYLCTTVAFAFALLRTWRYDRKMGWIVAGILAANVPLVFCESLIGQWWRAHFYPLDQAAFDALLIALIVLGVRSYALDRAPAAGVYLAAFVVPAIGAVINDLATEHLIAEPFRFLFEIGVAWEATFFAAAVAIRNRDVAGERDRFERLARVDGLTGVANRRTFDDELERAWTLARRARVPLAVAMIDIDRFKALNDERGHLAGDECLRRVAALCEGTLRRSGDCFARYGGEEFAAVLFNADAAAAGLLAERVRAAIQNDGHVTVSVGVAAAVPRDGGSASELLARADAALYRAKHGGRNRVVYEGGASTADGLGSVRLPDPRSETP